MTDNPRRPPGRPDDDRSAGRPQKLVANVVLGVALLARGRVDGLRQFGDTRQAFLNSMAPLVAFALVGAMFMLASGEGMGAVSDLLMTTCALLAPPVLSHAIARRWQREALWLRFATAFNWCQWAIPLALLALMVVVSLLMALGLPGRMAGAVVVFGLVGYGMWLHWFLARHALRLSPLRAVFIVLWINVGTVALVLAPAILQALLQGQGGEAHG